MSTKNALFSVSDKTGLAEDASRLADLGYIIFASGGTAKAIKTAGINVVDVADLVGGGSMLGHRVVTLSREVHAALLADSLKPEDLQELVAKNIPFIDFVRVDFYPLPKIVKEVTVFGDNRSEVIKQVVEGTDIGGPCMVRSAAKGFRIVVCRQQDMKSVLEELEKTGKISDETRQKLRARAEYEVAKYVGVSAEFHSDDQFRVIAGERVAEFKGENGHQTPAGLYISGFDDPLGLDKFTLIEGSPPSYNNWCDVDRLLQTITHIACVWKINHGFVPFIAVACKHGNPCGAAVGHADQPLEEVIQKMVSGDRRAIFGGLIMTNFAINGYLAEVMADAMPNGKALFDGVIAPDFNLAAIEQLSRVHGKCRLMTNPALANNGAILIDERHRFRYVRGGFLVQSNYGYVLNFNDPDLKVFGDIYQGMKDDLLLAWAIGNTSNSNTITITQRCKLIGNGVGQQDRVGAAELAVKRAIDAGHGSFGWWGRLLRHFGFNYAKNTLEGSVAYSDSFFPFADGAQVLIDAGVKAIFSTSGSKNDGSVQEVCAKNGVTLVQLPDAKARGFFGH